ncbi:MULTISPECIES: MlaD family protein [unclassified Thiocapsa]|uniref:MlaD family protein n=1 Tax=unclassified Thiocapsa TaxID=2641286 RepID=UPI0035ADFF33
MTDRSGPADRRLDRLYSPPEIGAPGKRRARAERRDLLFAGIFVIAMVAFAVAAFTLVLPGLFGKTYRLQAYFPDADGLDAGLQVVQEGYVVGLVERVEPVFPSSDAHRLHCPATSAEMPARSPTLPCFRATLRIRDNWPIPQGSHAQLAPLGLLKGQAISIRPGSSADLYADGAVIDAKAPDADLNERLIVLTETVRRVVEESIAPTLASIRDQVKTIELLIGTGEDQGENRDRLAGAFENLRLMSENLVTAVDPDSIGAILGSVEEMTASLALITGDMTGSTKDIRRAVTDYGDLAVDIRGLVNENRPAIQRSLDDTQFLLQSLSAALIPILTNIEDASRNLSALARDLRADPTLIIKRREQEEQAPWFR